MGEMAEGDVGIGRIDNPEQFNLIRDNEQEAISQGDATDS
jgi:hypothetical protein